MLANACKAPHLTLFVPLANGTAGRAAAILGLTWDRCDFERSKILLEDPEITTPHKGRAVVPMTKTLRLRLLEARAGAMSDFVIEWAGQRVGSVKKGLATASKAAGLKHVHPHMLRHSAAVRQAEQGVPIEEIASYLGHSNPKVTRDIYARFSPEALSKGAAALELDNFEPHEIKRASALSTCASCQSRVAWSHDARAKRSAYPHHDDGLGGRGNRHVVVRKSDT